MRLISKFLSIAVFALSAPLCLFAASKPFDVVVYNVENLFDLDGQSLFEDYRPPNYKPAHLATKLANISAVLRRFEDGAGPAVIMFVELEGDQTPARAGEHPMPESWIGTTAQKILAARRVSKESRDAPTAAWLLKQLEDDGLGPYDVAVGEYRRDRTRNVAHVNAVFSRFPITDSRTHQTRGARGILEVALDVEGHPLTVFVNHWKSGASDPSTEGIRIGNAEVLRKRLDAILREDPRADIIVGGDFNSQYNQKQLYPRMRRTAINDVLGSQGDELALREPNGADLYNLWFELSDEKRGSDVFRDKWGTLMQILITRGLYDHRGVQYVDNSFNVGSFKDLNAEAGTGEPVRWRFERGGSGFSDHLPVAAEFRVTDEGDAARWVKLDNPSRTVAGPSDAVPVGVSADSVPRLADLPRTTRFPDKSLVGRYFEVSGVVTDTRPFQIRVDGPNVELGFWIHDPDVRRGVFRRFRSGDRIRFVGEFGQYRGDWQFVVPADMADRVR